ncbi:hypothetical protein [Vibrio maritimus]
MKTSDSMVKAYAVAISIIIIEVKSLIILACEREHIMATSIAAVPDR